MATTAYTVNRTAYTEVSVLDNLLVNESNYVVRVAIADSLPTPTADSFTLDPHQGVIVNSQFMVGNTYVIVDSDALDEEAKVVVVEA